MLFFLYVSLNKVVPVVPGTKINVFFSGLLVGLVGLCGVELHYTPPSAWLTLGVLLAAGLTLALLNLYFQVIPAAVLHTE